MGRTFDARPVFPERFIVGMIAAGTPDGVDKGSSDGLAGLPEGARRQRSGNESPRIIKARQMKAAIRLIWLGNRVNQLNLALLFLRGSAAELAGSAGGALRRKPGQALADGIEEKARRGDAR